jgi:hypothetical protein
LCCLERRGAGGSRYYRASNPNALPLPSLIQLSICSQGREECCIFGVSSVDSIIARAYPNSPRGIFVCRPNLSLPPAFIS